MTHFCDRKRRIICFDVGEKRIGVALSDELGLLAHPVQALAVSGMDNAIASMLSCVGEYEPALVIIGDPVTLKGGESGTTILVRETAQRLGEQLRGISVILRDERLSTAAVEKSARSAGIEERKLRGKKDSLAAQWILQGYLDSQNLHS